MRKQTGRPRGRPKGSPNKVTAEIKAVAQLHGSKAIERLVKLMSNRSGAVSVAACRELLDRGYGKPTQPISGDSETPLVVELVRFADTNPQELAAT